MQETLIVKVKAEEYEAALRLANKSEHLSIDIPFPLSLARWALQVDASRSLNVWAPRNSLPPPPAGLHS